MFGNKEAAPSTDKGGGQGQGQGEGWDEEDEGEDEGVEDEGKDHLVAEAEAQSMSQKLPCCVLSASLTWLLLGCFN